MKRKSILCFSQLADVTVLIVLVCFCVLCLSGGSSSSRVEENERRALLHLRDSLNYPNGSALVEGWVGDDCCNWQGIFCGFNDSRVVGIYIWGERKEKLGIWYPNATIISQFKELESLSLVDNQIGGWVMGEALCGLKNLKTLELGSNRLDNESLPFCLFHNLPLLEGLGLSDNNLKGSSSFLSALCGLKNLKYLSLGKNLLDDESLPFCLFHNLPLLESLYLRENNLKDSSSLFSVICELRNLRQLYLGDNQLQGGIHPCFGEMKSLEFLDLSKNQFNGSFPSFSFSNLTSLEYLNLSDNSFGGILSFSMFANLSKLDSIDLSNNIGLEVETESPTWIPSFQLDWLDLSNCKLNARSGHVIPRFISNQHQLSHVYLSHSFLQGTIPSWLLYINSTTPFGVVLTLRGNSLSGQLPMSSQFQASTLLRLDISDNHIDGRLPSNIGKLFPKLVQMNISENALEGSIPSTLGNVSGLSILDLSNNFLQGKIPQTLTQNNTRLTLLVLSDNNFRGEVMPTFSNMPNLQCLCLQNNGFTGTITADMVNMPNLVLLDVSANHLSGNIPNSFPAHSNLGVLILARNIFHGKIPLSLCQMQNLNILDISANHLSAILPSCLSNITAWKKENPLLAGFPYFSINPLVKVPFRTKGNLLSYEGEPLSLMTGIDLSENHLSGEIPSQLGELIAVHSMNFSYNALTGHFPESFQNLENLESLDLSHNLLVGTLPPQIAQLHFISTFSVAFNNLSGRIPRENSFLTFTEVSYMGNSGLCGPPLKENCSSENPPQQDDGHAKEDKPGIAGSDLFFFSCVAVCYVLGFWAVIAPLILNRNWRRRYYKVVDRYIDLCDEKLFAFWFRVKNFYRN